MDFSSLKSPDEFLALIDIEDVWGVGRQYAKMLRARGITTALKLKNVDLKWIRKRMTVVGEKMVMEFRGVSCIPLEENPAPKKSIICSRSFADKVFRKEDLGEALASFVARATEKLRKQSSVAGRLELFARPSPFNGDLRSFSAGATLPHTDDSRHFIQLAHRLLDAHFQKGVPYRKAGVMLFDICPATNAQSDLFAVASNPAHHKLMHAVDKINKDWGSGTLTFAAEGLRKSWRMNRNHISKRYTTSWEELAVCSA